jgi:septal ring factor EnvC (AmiA/AmiB activator)
MIALLAFIAPASARSAEKSLVTGEKELEDVKKKIREGREKIEKIAEKEVGILGELEGIGKSLIAIEGDMLRSEESLGVTATAVERAEKRIDELSAARLGLVDRLRERLRGIYMFNSGEALRVLFAASSGEDASRRHKYLSVIMEADRKLITEYEENLAELDVERTRLESLKTDKEKVLVSYKSQKAEAEKARAKKSRVLGETRNERSRQEKLVRELETAAKELAAIIENLRKETLDGDMAGEFAAMRGRLVMPVVGKVVSFYGKVEHPKFKTVTFNNGIVIDAPLGESVRSVYDGKVAYVGWLKGYGQMMIVEHRGGFYTLFGSLHKTLKERGAIVARGEELGLVGESGITERPGLYFEVREGGVPRDPMAWLKDD